MDERQYYVYMLTNKENSVLYTGMTNDLSRRLMEHRQGLFEGFTKRYNCRTLVYFEVFQDPLEAIAREKQIKAKSRKRKEDLIHAINPLWLDLAGQLGLSD